MLLGKRDTPTFVREKTKGGDLLVLCGMVVRPCYLKVFFMSSVGALYTCYTVYALDCFSLVSPQMRNTNMKVVKLEVTTRVEAHKHFCTLPPSPIIFLQIYSNSNPVLSSPPPPDLACSVLTPLLLAWPAL